MQSNAITAALAMVLSTGGAAAVAQAPAGSGATDAPSGCSVCVPVPGTVKVTKVRYHCRVEEYCVPKARCLLDWFKSCGAGCLECVGPLHRRVLFKRVLTRECPGTTCELKTLPAAPCAPGPAPEELGAPEASRPK
jgi:hypothetical protein